MTAVRYIRQSRRADLDVALSRDAQLTATERLCGGCEVLEDMGRSGKSSGERLRPGYQRLLAGMASGEYTEVYAIALSRFSRSVPELHALMKLAEAKGVRIVTVKEGTMDPHTATGRMMFNTWANFAEFVRDMAVEAANENVAVRRSRGESMGRRPYGEAPGEDAAVVVDAYRRAGSYNGAAGILNEAGITSKLGRRWNGTSVRLVVRREAPGLAPRRPARGSGAKGAFRLTGLLRCSAEGCGTTLTGQTAHEGRYIRYHCHRADADLSHPRPKSVAEAAILPWLKAEAARFRAPKSVEMEAVSRENEREQLAARRHVIEDMYETNGPTWRDEYQRRLRAIVEAEDRLADQEAAATIVRVPPLDWNGDPEAINAYLRSIWAEVILDATMTPIEATWSLPSEWVR